MGNLIPRVWNTDWRSHIPMSDTTAETLMLGDAIGSALHNEMVQNDEMADYMNSYSDYFQDLTKIINYMTQLISGAWDNKQLEDRIITARNVAYAVKDVLYDIKINCDTDLVLAGANEKKVKIALDAYEEHLEMREMQWNDFMTENKQLLPDDIKMKYRLAA